MAKVTGPLFSLDASGTIADAMVFSDWKGLNYVRVHVIPANPRTELQVAQRQTLAAAVAAWRDPAEVPEEAKKAWNEYAEGTKMSGFNRFVRKFIEANPDKEPPWTVPEPS